MALSKEEPAPWDTLKKPFSQAVHVEKNHRPMIFWSILSCLLVRVSISAKMKQSVVISNVSFMRTSTVSTSALSNLFYEHKTNKEFGSDLSELT